MFFFSIYLFIDLFFCLHSPCQLPAVKTASGKLFLLNIDRNYPNTIVVYDLICNYFHFVVF
jgi:hypothetical protein